MKAKCCYCNDDVRISLADAIFFNALSREEKRRFLEAVICDVCANNKPVTLTAGGALACHVGHISGKVRETTDVSRETMGEWEGGK